MRSYLSLIPISAKVRRRQNRMTILCITFAVFLVTAIFSVADMMIQTESSFMLKGHGNWHIMLEDVSENIMEEIKEALDKNKIEIPYRINDFIGEIYDGTHYVEDYLTFLKSTFNEFIIIKYFTKCFSKN